ncbi:MAG: serine/threonine protein kinase [Nannocystales bacterium]
MASRHVALPRQLKLQGKVVAGRYLVEELIGVGGMAVVFRGQHMGLGRAVAIKVLRPEYGDNPEIAARFAREARASSGFDHPNCRAVLDCGELENGLKFMAMQLLEGRELAKVLGKPLPPSQCIALTLQVLRGLDHAHRHGVVHRDLKPDNLFVTKDHHGNDLLKIVDFGIARIVDEKLADGLTTKVGAIVGTPAYMSPEQALGEDIDGRADLYSVGMILYEMLTGAPPFSSTDARTLMKAHVAGRVPPLPPSVPPLINAGLSKLIARERARRYSDAAAAISGLERIARTLRSDAKPWVRLLDKPGPRRAPRSAPPPAPAPVGARQAPPAPAPSAEPTDYAVKPGDDTHHRKLRALDDALNKVLETHTPIAHESLQTGIRNQNEGQPAAREEPASLTPNFPSKIEEYD